MTKSKAYTRWHSAKRRNRRIVLFANAMGITLDAARKALAI